MCVRCGFYNKPVDETAVKNSPERRPKMERLRGLREERPRTGTPPVVRKPEQRSLSGSLPTVVPPVVPPIALEGAEVSRPRSGSTAVKCVNCGAQARYASMCARCGFYNKPVEEKTKASTSGTSSPLRQRKSRSVIVGGLACEACGVDNQKWRKQCKKCDAPLESSGRTPPTSDSLGIVVSPRPGASVNNAVSPEWLLSPSRNSGSLVTPESLLTPKRSTTAPIARSPSPGAAVAAGSSPLIASPPADPAPLLPTLSPVVAAAAAAAARIDGAVPFFPPRADGHLPYRAPVKEPRINFSLGTRAFANAKLEEVFETLELDDLLGAFKEPQVAQYFSQPLVVRKIIWFILRPQPPLFMASEEVPPTPTMERPNGSVEAAASNPSKEEEEEKQQRAALASAPSLIPQDGSADDKHELLMKIKIVSSELLTNPDSVVVLDTLVGNFELLDVLFSYWKEPVPDPAVFVSFTRLMDFLMHKRFYPFVRYIQVAGQFVLASMVRHLDVPDVSTLVHGMITKESFQVRHSPQLEWSRATLIPLVLERWNEVLQVPRPDSSEMILLCEFTTQLLLFHQARSRHILDELMPLFKAVTEKVIKGGASGYASEFLELFFSYFPPQHLQHVDLASALVMPPIDDEDVPEDSKILESRGGGGGSGGAGGNNGAGGGAPDKPRVVYHDTVELFLSSRLFQRSIRNSLHGLPPEGGSYRVSPPSKNTVSSSSSSKKAPLGAERWRSLQIVNRLIKMCLPTVDEALIISGALQKSLELFFEYPNASMVHSLVLDMLVYMLKHSAEAVNCWVCLEFGFIKKALAVVKEQLELPQVERTVSYTWHLVCFFLEFVSVLERNPVLAEVLGTSLESNQGWRDFRDEVLPFLIPATRYSVEPEHVERVGTFLERLQQAEDETPKKDTAPKQQQQDEAQEEEEEVIEEEVVEEVIEEEIVEEVIEEEDV